jgi:anaerobic selenocysteine-containing dehydrogenase
MATRRDVPGIRPYDSPAGGWGALRATAKAVRDQMDVTQAPLLLLRTNKSDGFDCPGCAWPDKDHTSTFQFCENGAKAVTWEATKRRTPPEFFAAHCVSELLEWSDTQLENEGRLTHPLYYDRATDKYRAVSWEDALARIGEILRALPDPNMAEFYTSGRTSNEAAFLYQLFAREYGTNNFPDCSNMCHEATSVGLPKSIGMGKGSVSLDDFDHCELIKPFGTLVGHGAGNRDTLTLTTIRSHDQYNTTIYDLGDRYRGVFGRRDIIFMNEQDLADRGLEHGDVVDIQTDLGVEPAPRLDGVTAVVYEIARGSVAAYYPEANCLVPLDYFDPLSGTPSYKSVPVRISRSVRHDQGHEPGDRSRLNDRS